MRWVDVFLARFKGPEVDACRPSGPAASSNRGCKIQLCATRRDQRLEHGAEIYRIQVNNNVSVFRAEAVDNTGSLAYQREVSAVPRDLRLTGAGRVPPRH